MKKIRLINLRGNMVAETEVKSEESEQTAILWANRVFLFAFIIGDWEHFREVKSERVRFVETAITSLQFQPEEKTKHDNENSKP